MIQGDRFIQDSSKIHDFYPQLFSRSWDKLVEHVKQLTNGEVCAESYWYSRAVSRGKDDNYGWRESM